MKKIKNNLTSPSVILLLLVNTMPLFGIFFWGWDSFTIIILYWLETVVVGFFNVLKIQKINKNKFSPWLPLFIIQYVVFLFAYLYLILNIFEPNLGTASNYLGAMKVVFEYLYSIILSFLFIFISHGISFQYNFINKKEFLQNSELKQFMAPYRRLIVMHVFIIFTAFGVIHFDFGKNVSAIIILIVVKTLFDLLAHLREHREKLTEV